ncbi:hypothetical protein [Haladaptatus sp. DFWS20]|uniref:hypothetical protein n=1 Tax=Haladaptatus sp. DFWS20 TaxID=3403467 RepID=UPI003EC12C92
MDSNADFTDKQVGKRVVAANGIEVGVVKTVRNGTRYVEVGSDVRGETTIELGWDGTVHHSVHELKRQFIADITDDTIRLSV